MGLAVEPAQADEAAAEPGPIAEQVAAFPLPAAVGVASWYGRSHAGLHTASGEIFSPERRTAAHRSLPLGTILKVTNLKSGKSAIVTVNDRGPYIAGRLIDLSEGAARDLAMVRDGLAQVKLEVIAHE